MISDPKPISRTSAFLYAIRVGSTGLPAGFSSRCLSRAFGLPALLLARVNPIIYRARSRFQPGTEKWDLILAAVMLPAIVIEIPLRRSTPAGWDGPTYRFGWS
jgi:hypothetical protein